MPWQTPTLDELVSGTIRDINAEMPGADAALARNNLNPVAKVLAGGLHSINLFAAWAADQRFVLTCSAEFLDRHGAEMKPAVPRKGASSAAGAVTMSATSAVTLATGAILQRSDGEQFRVDAGAVAGSGASVTINVTAVKAGAASATLAAAPLTISSGLTGTATFAVGSGGLGGAADAESDASYRARLLFAKAFPEHAGAPADWLRYTLAVPGVTRAYIDPLAAGRGTVVVYPFFDLTRPNGIGLESDRLAVASALAVARPGAGLPVVRLPVAVAIAVTLSGVLPATPEVQSAIAGEIAATFARNSRPAGLSATHPSMPFLATPASFSRSWIWQAAANASGEERHSVTLPAADVTLTEGQVAVPGVISFV
jgi:uncharacterized phage protein gp47/JayE